jgi:hypothetical protein
MNTVRSLGQQLSGYEYLTGMRLLLWWYHRLCSHEMDGMAGEIAISKHVCLVGMRVSFAVVLSALVRQEDSAAGERAVSR